MSDLARLWIRHEVRETERRAPIVPADAGRLVERGITVTVEESPQRVFPIGEYAAAGCAVTPAGSWVDAPADHHVLGLKELPDRPPALTHRHIFFGHAYKGQHGSRKLLRRFAAGGGALLDLEYLVDDDGRRLAAFGYWAGYVGAALGVLHLRGRLTTPLRPVAKHELDEALGGSADGDAPSARGDASPAVAGALRALVVGALGRCGRGACAALETAGHPPTRWDVGETRELDRAALLGHDLLVNTVLATRPIPPFLTRTDLDDRPRRLAVVSDVSCDVTSACNTLPIYDRLTDWQHPVRRLRDAPPLDLIAIDNLPSLLPREASVDFSAQLLPQLMSLGGLAPPWQRCLRAFEGACRDAEPDGALADV